MILNFKLGSTNPAKVEALREELSLQGIDFDLDFFEVETGVKKQPLGLDESFCGARNRALGAHKDKGDLAIGIEDGCFLQDSKILNICCTCLWDGEQFTYASSSSFQLPISVQQFILKDKLELSEALYQAELTKNKNIGQEGGAISLITKNKLTRKNYTRQALLNLLSTWKLENDLP